MNIKTSNIQAHTCCFGVLPCTHAGRGEQACIRREGRTDMHPEGRENRHAFFPEFNAWEIPRILFHKRFFPFSHFRLQNGEVSKSFSMCGSTHSWYKPNGKMGGIYSSNTTVPPSPGPTIESVRRASRRCYWP